MKPMCVRFLALMLCLAAVLPSTQAAEEEVLNFALLDQRGRMHELRRTEGNAVVLFFTANGCPVARQSAPKLRALQDRFGHRGVQLLLVNTSPADDAKSMARESRELGLGRGGRHQHEGLDRLLPRRDR